MNVTFYQNTSDKRYLTKNLINGKTYSGLIIKESLDVLNTVFKIQVTNDSINFIMGFYNYMYVEDLERYYFITDRKLLNGMVAEISGHEDVLMTYPEIRNLNATITRQENIGINDIVDPLLPLQNKKNEVVIEFSNSEFNIGSAGKNDYNFVLNVSGGGSGQTGGGGTSTTDTGTKSGGDK